MARLNARNKPSRIRGVSLLKRMREVLSERGWDESEWAIEAGLRERTHVSTILRRLEAKPESSVDMKTLIALADAAGVTLDWLATGREPKYRAVSEKDPRYPSRGQAIAAARLIGIPEHVIAAVANVDDLSQDPGAAYWLQRLMLAAQEPGTGSKRE